MFKRIVFELTKPINELKDPEYYDEVLGDINSVLYQLGYDTGSDTACEPVPTPSGNTYKINVYVGDHYKEAE